MLSSFSCARWSSVHVLWKNVYSGFLPIFFFLMKASFFLPSFLASFLPSFLPSFLSFFLSFWLCWVFVSVRGLSLVVASGGHSSSRCAGLSLLQTLPLRSTSSRRASAHFLIRLFDFFDIELYELFIYFGN